MENTPDYSGKRFLIVDDEPFMLGLIDRMLKQCKAGFIAKATDGGSAMRSVKDTFTQVDCIISDCNMKPINGLQLLQGIRVGINPRIPREQPFIMLTGHGETDVVKAALALDTSGYVVKPVAPEKLFQTIDNVFRRPVNLKEPDHYRAIRLPQVQSAFGEPEATKSTPWTLLPSGGPFKHSESMKRKIDQFRSEHSAQTGAGDEVKIKNRRECPIDEILEGQILAADIEAEEGVILVRKGTPLTKPVLNRLKELAAESNPKQLVWIGELAT